MWHCDPRLVSVSEHILSQFIIDFAKLTKYGNRVLLVLRGKPTNVRFQHNAVWPPLACILPAVFSCSCIRNVLCSWMGRGMIVLYCSPGYPRELARESACDADRLQLARPTLEPRATISRLQLARAVSSDADTLVHERVAKSFRTMI